MVKRKILSKNAAQALRRDIAQTKRKVDKLTAALRGHPDRRVRWQAEKMAQGLCGLCGENRMDPKSKRHCRPCLDKIAARMKARRNQDGSTAQPK